jgi:hypothetical protein
MRSVAQIGIHQTLIGDSTDGTTGLIFTYRGAGTNNITFNYSNGSTRIEPLFSGFFTGLDNQYIHIVFVCDYANKTLKAYRNGVQFGATQNLTGTPLFPSIARIRYIGALNSTAYKLTDGSLDEVRIYNRGLSAIEIMNRYNKTKSRYE